MIPTSRTVASYIVDSHDVEVAEGLAGPSHRRSESLGEPASLWTVGVLHGRFIGRELDDLDVGPGSVTILAHLGRE